MAFNPATASPRQFDRYYGSQKFAKDISASMKKRFGAGSALGGLARQGYSGKGWTGSPE